LRVETLGEPPKTVIDADGILLVKRKQATEVQHPLFSGDGVTLLVAVDTDLGSASWGAWMEHAAFAVEDTTMVEEGVRIDARFASVLGDLSQSRPSDNAAWQGVLVGTPIDGSRKGNMLTGNARLTFDSRQQQIDATFSGIFDMTIGAPHTFANVRYDNIPIRANGTYEAGASGNKIQGAIYGPGHAETAGIFEQRNIVGAFGARQ